MWADGAKDLRITYIRCVGVGPSRALPSMVQVCCIVQGVCSDADQNIRPNLIATAFGMYSLRVAQTHPLTGFFGARLVIFNPPFPKKTNKKTHTPNFRRIATQLRNAQSEVTIFHRHEVCDVTRPSCPRPHEPRGWHRNSTRLKFTSL